MIILFFVIMAVLLGTSLLLLSDQDNDKKCPTDLNMYKALQLQKLAGMRKKMNSKIYHAKRDRIINISQDEFNIYLRMRKAGVAEKRECVKELMKLREMELENGESTPA